MHLVPIDTDRSLIPDAATAAARAFTFDTLFLWLRPYGAPKEPCPSYPLPDPQFEATPWFRYLRLYFLFRIRKSIATPNFRVFAAVSDESDSWWAGQPQVMGNAIWTREWVNYFPGREERSKREKYWLADSLSKRFERKAVGLEQAYADKLVLDKAYEPKNLRLFSQSWEYFGGFTDQVLKTEGKGAVMSGGPQARIGSGLGKGEGYVWLQFLSVDPQFQRKGVGGALLSWGIERAKDEDVPAGLTASPQGQGLYKKWGFEDVGTNNTYGDMEDIFMVAWIERKE